MKYNIKYIVMALGLLPAYMASAQNTDNDKFAIRATAEKNITSALYIDHSVDNLSTSSSSWNYGLEFAWRIWEKGKHSIEANVGLGYGTISLKSSLPAMDYHYNAPAEADMDGVPYIRYYDIDGIYQKIKTERITIPLYVNYRYKFSKVFSLHGLFGFRFGINYKSKLANSTTEVFSYGVYPIYDDLMIDAPYMNEFGAAEVGAKTNAPRLNKVIPSFMFGLGAEFSIYGPFAIDLSVKYEGSSVNMYKAPNPELHQFEALNAPVTYTVKDGQRVASLASYLSQSKISDLSCAVSLLYRF